MLGEIDVKYRMQMDRSKKRAKRAKYEKVGSSIAGASLSRLDEDEDGDAEEEAENVDDSDENEVMLGNNVLMDDNGSGANAAAEKEIDSTTDIVIKGDMAKENATADDDSDGIGNDMRGVTLANDSSSD